MDHRQKSALRKNHITLADQLILDEDFFAQLRQIKIFSEGMIAIIKAETKPRNQVYKMLELLEKRGPQAFGNFISILRENFWWVADKLEETYQEKMEAAHTTKQDFQRQQSRQTLNERPRKLQRAVSTPLQSKVPRPVPIQIHTSASTCQFPIGQQETYVRESYRAYNNPDHTEYSDIEDELDGATPMNDIGAHAEVENEGVDPGNKTNESSIKSYVDKSLSPIHILECRSNRVPEEVCNQEQALNEEEQEGTRDLNNAGENAPNTNNDNSETVNEHQEDNVDGSKKDDNLGAVQEDFECSESYYDSIRAESVFEDEDEELFYLEKMHEDEDAVAADGGEEQGASADSSHLSELSDREDEDVRAIREIYVKLQWLTDEENRITGNEVSQEGDKDIDETGLTFQMIIDKLDELVAKHKNSDVQKIITACYKLFDEKDKKLPLYTCIQKLKDANKELNTRLLEEMRKTNEMAHDMYTHSQDMKNLEKLKSKTVKFENENTELKDKLESSEKVKSEQARRISELETKLFNLEELRKEEKKAQRRTGISPKRSSINTGMTTRKPLYSDPRMAIMQTGYQANKSPRTQSTTSAWRPYKK